MPIYEYECAVCSKRTELLQKMSDPPLKECPDCQGSVRKVLSAAGLHFKGSGWYVTDYAKKTSQKTDKSMSEKKQASTGSDKKKKESTPQTSKGSE